jgi:hypothetical protein
MYVVVTSIRRCNRHISNPKRVRQVIPSVSLQGNDMTKSPYPGDDSYGFDRWWENDYLGFDNIGTSFISLFVITTQDEWPLMSHRIWV